MLEAAVVPRAGGTLLALHRIGVDVIAREAVARGDEIGRDALRHEVRLDRDRRIGLPGAASGADADPAHGLHPAADRHVLLPGHDLRRGEVDGVETGGAEAVDLQARHPVAVVGDQRGTARDVAAGLAHRIDAAEHHVVDQARIELAPALDRPERLGGEIERGDLVQSAVGLAAAARGAHVIVDEGFGH
jgi:hypothetical protein